MNDYHNQAQRLGSLVNPELAPIDQCRLPVAILTGEGIGPEIFAACRPIMDTIESCTAYRFDLDFGGEIGNSALRKYGDSLTNEIVEYCHKAFARRIPLLCGPAGDQFVYKLRRQFDAFCKFVPIKPLPALKGTGPMRAEAVQDVDILLLRENIGGLYQGSWRTELTSGAKTAHHSFSYTEQHVSRIMNVAVDLAKKRRGKLCVLYKPGGAPSVSTLWREVAEYHTNGQPVELRLLEVDTAAYLVLAEANDFDVIVTPNMFGDVVADVAALLLGSRGMSYSFNMGEHGVAIYQTAHGAAYDLAHTHKANPLAQIQTFATMMSESFGLLELAGDILEACNNALAIGARTADIALPDIAPLTTEKMGQAVADQLRQILMNKVPVAKALTI